MSDYKPPINSIPLYPWDNGINQKHTTNKNMKHKLTNRLKLLGTALVLAVSGIFANNASAQTCQATASGAPCVGNPVNLPL